MANSVKARFQSIKLLKNEQLGIGSYGMVCKALCDGLLCAAKLLHPTIASARNSQNFDQECQVLSAIKHPNVIQYLGTHQDPETRQQVLIMELMDESLTSFVERAEKDGRAPLPLHVQLNICHEIALALRYFHQNDIIHRDLSSNNVLSLGGKRFKVTDFGMSKLINSGTNVMSLTQCPGCPAYMSPEALETPPVYSKKLDTFSFGVLTIQILTSRFPDPGPPKRKVRDPKYPVAVELPVFDTERRKSHIDLIPPTHPLLGISKVCLSYQEEDRPTAVELCDHISGLKLTAEYIQSVQGESEDKLMLENKGLKAINSKNENIILSLKKDIELLKQENEEKCDTILHTWTIQREEIQIIEDNDLGVGSWGYVKVAVYHDLKVAVKQLHEVLLSPHTIESFVRQVHFLACIKHPNIIQFIGGVMDQDGAPMIVMELMSYTCWDIVQKQQLDNHDVLSISIDVALALNHLHLIKPDPIIHLNVISANVLLTPSTPPMRWKAKLAGFGAACYLSKSDEACPGNPIYAAPESRVIALHSPKMDVYSYGVLLLELCTGQYPDIETRAKQLEALRWKSMMEIIRPCLQEDPSKRPHMKQLVNSLTHLESFLFK